MQVIKLIHNPTAGDEDHGKKELIREIEDAGFECRYSSTKEEGWKEIDEDTDLLIVAGGDGTVRKAVKLLLKRKLVEKSLPLGLLALGTANNIARTFSVDSNIKKVVKSWNKKSIKNVDVGLVENIPDVDFFLEGLGFGIFPYLMKEMKENRKEYPTPEDELKACLRKLADIIGWYEPRSCKLEVDGTDHSGKFLLVEVLNIKSIGPNIVLAPFADPGDGELEVVLVPEAHKEKFADYIANKIAGKEVAYQFHTLKGKKIEISWDGTRVHADDEMLKLDRKTDIKIQIKESALQFLI